MAGVVRYNGVSLELVRTVQWITKTVSSEDNADLLYWHHHIILQCIYNRSATASAPGDLPMLSWRELREKLLVKRGQLHIEDGAGNVGLRLPGNPGIGKPFVTDANLGPHPLDCRIDKVIGDASMIVLWSVECYEPIPCKDRNISVLSHRWEDIQEYDDSYLTTRTITGTATFRTDSLLSRGVRPDDFRARLFHGIPDNFRRMNVRVKQNSAGNQVTYAIQDVEQWVNTGREHGIRKISGHFGQGYSNPADGWAWQFIKFASRWRSIVVDVWGFRTTPYVFLINCALRAVIGYGFPVDLISPPRGENLVHIPGYSSEISVDLTERHVTYKSTFMTGGNAFAEIAGGGTWLLASNFPEPNDGILWSTLFGDSDPKVLWEANKRNRILGNRAPFPDNCPPPFDSGTRGTFLEKLVAQELLAPCGTPANPRLLKSDTTKTWTFEGADPLSKSVDVR